MSVVTWAMKVVRSSGTTQSSLSAWGIEKPVVSFRSMDDDEFTFEAKQDATVPTLFNFGDAITLYKNTGGTQVTWFMGTITKREIIANPQSESVRYVASGPWWKLKRSLLQIKTQCYSANACLLQSTPMSKVVLYQDPTTGASITTAQQIANVIAYALTLGIGIVAGTGPGSVYVPFEETRDLTLSDAIRRCMQWTPDGVGWIDYSSGAAIFNAQQRAFLSSATINLSNNNLVSGLTLIPRDDLVPSGVRFNYVGSALCNVQVPNGCADPSTGIVNNTGVTITSKSPVQVQTITADSSGTPDLPGGIIGTLDLAQLTATTFESAPVGLAGLYYLSLATLTWDGSLTTHEQECSGTLRPGKVVNLTGGAAAWATMNALIQEVHESLYDGTTTVTFGTPGHLQPQNFATLFQMVRHRALVTTGLVAVNTPGAGGSRCPQGLSPETQKILARLGGSGAAAAAAIDTSGNGKNLGANLNQCSVNVCVNGVLTPQKFYCPPQ